MTKQMNDTFNTIETDTTEMLQRLCNLQKDYKKLYEEGDRTLIGVSNSAIQISSKQFFSIFKEYDLKPMDSEYIEANAEYKGVKFITLIRTVEKEG